MCAACIADGTIAGIAFCLAGSKVWTNPILVKKRLVVTDLSSLFTGYLLNNFINGIPMAAPMLGDREACHGLAARSHAAHRYNLVDYHDFTYPVSHLARDDDHNA